MSAEGLSGVPKLLGDYFLDIPPVINDSRDVCLLFVVLGLLVETGCNIPLFCHPAVTPGAPLPSLRKALLRSPKREGRPLAWIRLCPKHGRRRRGHRQRTAEIWEDAGVEGSDPGRRDERRTSPPTRVEPPHLYLRINEQGHVPVAMRIATLTCLPGPSPFLLLLAQLLLRLLLSGPELAGAASSCPSRCTCSNQASRVICTRQSLDEVPESISVNTRYLNLQENSIQVSCLLHPAALCSSSQLISGFLMCKHPPLPLTLWDECRPTCSTR